MTKHIVVSDDTHSKIMQYKAANKLKSQDETIIKMLEDLDWIP